MAKYKLFTDRVMNGIIVFKKGDIITGSEPYFSHKETRNIREGK